MTTPYRVFGDTTAEEGFFGNTTPFALQAAFGTPLYVYNEAILRRRCKEILSLVDRDRFVASYSAKANTNLALLRIAREEGMHVDAMSPGEIHIELLAGFRPEEILYICNNVSSEEMRYAVDKGVMVSVDSLAQLRRFGEIAPGGEVAVRFNPGLGAGHHAKVVTAGKGTKFGVSIEDADEVAALLARFDLTLVGLNQHIGSLFMEGSTYLGAAENLLEVAARFPTVRFVDFGGGFGVPYRKQTGEARLDLRTLGVDLTKRVERWCEINGREIACMVEPGRYIAAECGVLLGAVHATKVSSGVAYAGTDLGFNVLIRPAMYDAHHDLEVYRSGGAAFGAPRPVTVVGNICETGDILTRDHPLPPLEEGDLIGVLDAGAYGYTMSSQYNQRLRPAEVLIDLAGNPRLIRRRDTLEDLVRQFPS